MNQITLLLLASIAAPAAKHLAQIVTFLFAALLSMFVMAMTRKPEDIDHVSGLLAASHKPPARRRNRSPRGGSHKS